MKSVHLAFGLVTADHPLAQIFHVRQRRWLGRVRYGAIRRFAGRQRLRVNGRRYDPSLPFYMIEQNR